MSSNPLLKSSPNIACKESVYQRYDHQVQTNTVISPGADGALIRIKGNQDSMKVLHLVLKRKYFERIYNKSKRVEYRDFTSYWQRRLEGKHFTHIKFQLAYSQNPPTMLVEVTDRNVVNYKDDLAYAFDLGEIVEVKNYRPPTK